MKQIIFILSLIAVSFSSCKENKEAVTTERQEQIDTIPTLILQIQKCSKLYTAEYNVHKIVTHDDVVRLKGEFFSKKFNFKVPAGDRKIAIPINATLKAYVDFSGFSESNIITDGQKITIILPDPKVALTSSKVDHRSIKEFVSLTRSKFTDEEMASYEQQGRASIIKSIPHLGIIETARDNAAHTLIPILMQLGYEEKNITVSFRKEFDDNDLNILLDKTTIEKR